MKNEKLRVKSEEMKSEKERVKNGRRGGKLWRSGMFCAFFIFTFSFFSCNSPLDFPQSGNPASANTGTFSLAMNGVQTGRTILPKTVQSDFAVYTLAFAPTVGGAAQNVDRTNANLADSVELVVGTYTLTVTAYMDAGKTKPAAAGSLAGIVIGAGAAVSKSVTLEAVIENGEGTFRWNITLPEEVVSASMTVTPLDSSGTAEQIINVTTTPVSAAPRTLKAGYYRVLIKLNNSTVIPVVHREYLHIYKNMESVFEHDFTGVQFPIVVTNNNNDGEGSLRQAVSDAADGGVIAIAPNVGTITLASSVAISKSLTIDGNGVIITLSGSDYSLMTISGASSVVSISRVWFKDGRRTSTYAAGGISSGGTVTLESCIFSGNQVTNTYSGSAIHNTGTMTIKGCTFYGNSCADNGGVIRNETSSSSSMTLSLEGNLFYGNTTGSYSAVVYKLGGYIITSLGYNVVDQGSSGFDAASNGTDKGSVSAFPISPASLRLFSGSPAANVITALSADYPVVDFYGNSITAPAAAGAVQFPASGYYLELLANNSAYGSVSASPSPDSHGVVSPGNVTITATPVAPYLLSYWLVNGVKTAPTSLNTLSLNIATHTLVQAVFVRVIEVTVFTDSASGNGDTGTLRAALFNAQDGDVIRFIGVTAGTSTVTLERPLEITGTKNITIEGNGITLTPVATWTASATSQLLRITSAGVTVTISGVHFKSGRATDMGSSAYGGAININNGNLTLESCIFSDNQNSGTYGGAISMQGGTIMNVKGCTFYNNSATYGGAIYNTGTTLTLEGNLFYGNTATGINPVVRNVGTRTATSLGYNVVNRAFGTGDTQSGFDTASNGTDKTVANLLGNNATSPFTDATNGDFSPVTGIKVNNVALPAAYPIKDFFGFDRVAPWAAGAVK